MTTDASDRNDALSGITQALMTKPQPVEKEKLQITLSGEIANTQASPPPPSVHLPFKTAVLRRLTQWDNLFKGFVRMKAVSFVVQVRTRITVDSDAVHFRYCDALSIKAVANCLSWQASPVLDSTKAFLLSRSDEFAVDNQAS